MNSSNKPIIEHIPQFLEYCEKEKSLSSRTIENYDRFLNRFTYWLKESNLIDLSPKELSIKHIQKYKNYLLEQISPATKRPITKKTRNFYLIALRALLHYFVERDIPSLLPQKVKLLKEARSQPLNKSPSLKHFEKLLETPDTSTIKGLRDKALLETLFTTGLKVSQLAALNRDQIEIEPGTKNLEIKISDKENFYPRTVYISERAVGFLRKYLKTRKDKHRALFINYRRRRGTSRRLTARSIQKFVKKYARKANFPFSLTPEILRNAHTLSILDQQDEIKITKNPLSHKTLITKAYRFAANKGFLKSRDIKSSNERSFWHIVEKIINNEVFWLKNNIPILPESYKPKYPLINCNQCLFRKIAILIVSGKIKTIEFKAERNKDLWNGLTTSKEELQEKSKHEEKSKHGEEWHRKMMDVIFEYFKLQNCRVVTEPVLNHGRADLEVYSSPRKAPLYIEVGTVSLYKLWYNLMTMKNVGFLLVPSENYAIEFKA